MSITPVVDVNLGARSLGWEPVTLEELRAAMGSTSYLPLLSLTAIRRHTLRAAEFLGVTAWIDVTGPGRVRLSLWLPSDGGDVDADFVWSNSNTLFEYLQGSFRTIIVDPDRCITHPTPIGPLPPWCTEHDDCREHRELGRACWEERNR